MYIYITKLITDNYCSTHSECLKGIFIKAYEIISDIMHPQNYLDKVVLLQRLQNIPNHRAHS